jgi:hypothetical protein
MLIKGLHPMFDANSVVRACSKVLRSAASVFDIAQGALPAKRTKRYGRSEAPAVSKFILSVEN